MSVQRASESRLAEGDRLGSYEILSFIGLGGMGQVYRAKDTRLGRIVALKVLSPEISGNQDRRQRFLNEARTLSSLKHPNVCTVYDFGSEEGIDFLVMEYVEGETLATRLRRGPLSMPETLQGGIEIAAALDAAHSSGIVHRDIKPGNIMLTKSGVKLLDFGLAKMRPLVIGDSTEKRDEASGPQTEAGMIVGTLAYISPEQLDGNPADTRSDLFAFGAVLFEMATGTRAFDAHGSAGLVQAILQHEPPAVSEIRGTPLPMFDRLVQRCLTKDPQGRVQSARDAQLVLQWINEKPDGESSSPPATRRWLLIAMGILLVLMGLLAAFTYRGSKRALALHVPDGYTFTPLETTAAYEGFPDWSPDGKTIAYAAETNGVLQIFTRSLESTRRTQLTHLSSDCREPFWTPDGTRILFIALAETGDALWSVGAAGGAPVLVIADVSTAAISPDGKTLALLREERDRNEFSVSLWFADGGGAGARKYSAPGFNNNIGSGVLRFSPDGTRLGAWVRTRRQDNERDREFWEILFPRMELRKAFPALVALPSYYPFSWMPDSQRIVFGADLKDRLPGSHLWLADERDGSLKLLTATHGNESYPSVSPDGRRIVFTSEDADFDLMEIPLDGSPNRVLLATSRVEKMPAWSPDGSQYAFVTNRSGGEEIWVRSADGAWEQPVATRKDFPGEATSALSNLSFSPDGQRLAYQRAGELFRIWISSIRGGPAIPLINPQKFTEDHPTWSPDGSWLAFTSFLPATHAGQPAHAALLKIRIGGREPPIVLQDQVLVSGEVKWSPAGDWITCETADGTTLVSPAGGKSRTLTDAALLTHEWARDGKTIYAIRMEGLHLALVRIAVPSGLVTVIRDLGPSPPMNFPYQGLSLSGDGKTLATSTPTLRGDLWMLEGFEPPP